jgi:hypothetical protein
MARHLAYGGRSRPMAKGASSFACLAFVALLGAAFWAGAVWIGQAIMQIVGFGL